MQMIYIFRLDYGYKWGLGHYYRCLALSEELIKNGGQIIWIVRSTKENFALSNQLKNILIYPLSSRLSKKNEIRQCVKIISCYSFYYKTFILDHYGWDDEDERFIKSQVDCLMVIDDFSNKKHVCDIYLNPSFSSDKHINFFPCPTLKLCSAQYLLLSSGFQRKKQFSQIHFPPKNIFIFFGASDPEGETIRVLKHIHKKNYPYIFHVVVGASNLMWCKIERLILKMKNVRYYYNLREMPQLMRKMDVAIGSGGMNLWERCSVGLVSVVSSLSEDQDANIHFLAKKKCLLKLGNYKTIIVEDYFDAIESLTQYDFKKMRQNMLKVCDGKGVVRVSKILMNKGKLS